MTSLTALIISRSTSAHSNAGGMERVYESVADELLKRGLRVDLLTTRIPGTSRTARLPTYNRVIEAWPVARPGRYSVLWWLFTLLFCLRSRRSYDVVLSVSSAGLMAAVVTQIPVVGQCHGTAWTETIGQGGRARAPSQILRTLLNLSRVPRDVIAYRLFDSVIAISHAIKVDLTSMPYMLEAESVSVIVNGVDFEKFQFCDASRERLRRSHGFDASDCVGIFSGRVTEQKGADLCVEALALLDRRFRLLVCGNGPLVKRLEARTEELDISGRVVWIGNVDDRCVAEYMSAADVALLPSRRREGMSISLLESLAAGLPVVGTRALNPPRELWPNVTPTQPTVDGLASAWLAASDVEARTPRIPNKFSSAVALTDHVNTILGVAYAEIDGKSPQE